MEDLSKRLIQAARDDNFAAVQALVREGADVNAQPEGEYYNALHAAIEHGDPRDEGQDLLRFLLQAGADPNSICGDLTALQHAIELEGDAGKQSLDPECFRGNKTRALLEAGADPNNPGVLGETPLKVAEDLLHGAAFVMLYKYGAKLDR